MGIVFLAEDRRTHLPVAAKVMSRSLSDPELQARFMKENQILASLNHRNIVRCYEITRSREGLPTIVMEYLRGVDFGAFEGRPFPELLPMMVQAAMGLAYLKERNILHRDLSPNNIFVTLQDDRRLVKILDFGVAKVMQEGSGGELTQTGEFLGKLAYASHELLTFGHVDFRSDIYSLGVIYFRLLTKRRPINVQNSRNYLEWVMAQENRAPIDFSVPEGNPPIPDSLQALVQKMLAKKSDDRPQGYEEIIDAIVAAQGEAEKAGLVPDPETVSTLPSRSRRSRSPAPPAAGRAPDPVPWRGSPPRRRSGRTTELLVQRGGDAGPLLRVAVGPYADGRGDLGTAPRRRRPRPRLRPQERPGRSRPGSRLARAGRLQRADAGPEREQAGDLPVAGPPGDSAPTPARGPCGATRSRSARRSARRPRGSGRPSSSPSSSSPPSAAGRGRAGSSTSSPTFPGRRRHDPLEPIATRSRPAPQRGRGDAADPPARAEEAGRAVPPSSARRSGASSIRTSSASSPRRTARASSSSSSSGSPSTSPASRPRGSSRPGRVRPPVPALVGNRRGAPPRGDRRPDRRDADPALRAERGGRRDVGDPPVDRRSGRPRDDPREVRQGALLAVAPRGTPEAVPLRRIEIEGFRGIRRMALDLDETTALIGENSCGKTSVLDALELSLAHRATLPSFGPLDFHLPSEAGAAPAGRISLRFTFLEEGGRGTVAEISASRTADGSPAAATARLFDRDGRDLHADDPGAFEAFRRRHPVLRVRFGRPARTVHQEPAARAPRRPGPGRAREGPAKATTPRSCEGPSRRPTGNSRVRGGRTPRSCASRPRPPAPSPSGGA